MTTTTSLPLPTVPPEVEAFAAENGVSEYLPKMLELARRIFPTQPITVQVYEDHEIRDLKKILIEVWVPRDTDFINVIDPLYQAWGWEFIKTAPTTHLHLFGITFEILP
jgi:hypothetical protein